MTTCGATSDDKVGIMIILSFLCIYRRTKTIRGLHMNIWTFNISESTHRKIALVNSITLKKMNRQNANLLVTDGTVDCHNDSMRCRKWRQSLYWFSVIGAASERLLHNLYKSWSWLQISRQGALVGMALTYWSHVRQYATVKRITIGSSVGLSDITRLTRL